MSINYKCLIIINQDTLILIDEYNKNTLLIYL